MSRAIHDYNSDELAQLVRTLESAAMLELFFPLLKRDEDEAIEEMVAGLQSGTEEGTSLAKVAAGRVLSLRHICAIHDLALEVKQENEK